MTVAALRFKTIYQSAQETCEFYAGRPWVDGIPAESEAGDLIVNAELSDEKEAVELANNYSLQNAGYISDNLADRATL